MNCSDISLILDDRDTGTLNDEFRKAADAHVAECRDCARDWKLHSRLVARKLPAFPHDLLDECSALAVASPAAPGSRRKWNRATLATGIVLLVAAAATLTFFRDFGTGNAQVPSSLPPGSGPQDRGEGNVSSSSSSQEISQAQVNSPSVAPNAAAGPTHAAGGYTFSVRLSTLPNDTLNAADKSNFNIFRTAVIDELHRAPGLILVLTEASTSVQAVEFEITLTADVRNGELIAHLDAGKSGPNSVAVPFRIGLGQGCAPTCVDVASTGANVGRKLAELMTPPATAVQSAFLKELQDGSLTPEQRLEALRNLDRRGLSVIRTGGLRTDPSGDSLRDPAIIRAVIDLVSVAPNPEQRAEIWKKMRSIRSPALIDPLARAAQLDPDITVRTEAVTTLVADYARDPRSRAALELIARTDSHSLLRAMARRGLLGEAGWKSYVLSSLEDTTLPDAQRLEAFLFHVRNAEESSKPLDGVLDDDAIKALTQVLLKAGSTGTDQYGVTFLLVQLGPVKHPAVTSMLLAGIELRDSRFNRSQFTEMLADRMEEPGVRAALEKIAKSDPDERSRKIAAQALQDNE